MSSITTDLGSWAALLGIMLPALVALLQRDHWSSVINGIIFGVAVVVASVVYAWLKFSPLTWEHWASTLYAVVIWGIATYHLYWKPSGISTQLRAVPKTKP